MKHNIALSMMELMLKKKRNTIWYGDIELIEECARLNCIEFLHPQKTIKRILDSLENSPYFIKGYIIADFNGVKRRYRCFELKKTGED